MVVSFDGSELTIDLANGGMLEGFVGDYTHFKCRSEVEAEKSHRKRHGAHKSTDDALDEPEGEGEGEDVDEPSDEEFDDEPKDGEEPDEKPDKKKCSAANLTPGTGVHEAKLKLTEEGLFFKRLELLL